LFVIGKNVNAENLSGKIVLTNNINDFTIENEYYKAVIPKAGQAGNGIVKLLYVKKQDNSWSNNLVKENLNSYGLGYLESANDAHTNDSFGLSSTTTPPTILVIQNDPKIIKIKSSNTVYGVEYNEVWTFYASKPYFKSDADATRVGDSVLANQLQFCDMVNDSLLMKWYATDKNGEAAQLNGVVMQPLNSPYLNSYPWINYQFTNENVSLGKVFPK